MRNNRITACKIPNKWYNILSDLPEDLPPDLENETNHSIEDMKKIRPKMLNSQDQSKERYIDIPDEVVENLERIGRPTPLMRAERLERYLDTTAKIYIKREDVLPTHSFKLNSAIAQAYYARQEGFEGVISESGAGQWGLALSYACSLFGLKNQFFWVKLSREQKKFRASWCEIFDAKIIDSPSNLTSTGKRCLEQDPNCPGSLGIAIGEAIEYAKKHPNYAYLSGSNLNHVLLHQSVIGLEAKEQFKELDIKPDYFVACCGGGSNLGGFIGPFIYDKEYQGKSTFVAAESLGAPRLTRGEYKYDNADPYGITPRVKSYTLGRDYMPSANHVGGLRQHNGSPIIGYLRHHDLLDAKAFSQEEALLAGEIFAKCYGIIPAPESSHALKAAIDIALEAKEKKESPAIALCLSGNGVLDMKAYQTMTDGKG